MGIFPFQFWWISQWKCIANFDSSSWRWLHTTKHLLPWKGNKKCNSAQITKFLNFLNRGEKWNHVLVNSANLSAGLWETWPSFEQIAPFYGQSFPRALSYSITRVFYNSLDSYTKPLIPKMIVRNREFINPYKCS